MRLRLGLGRCECFAQVCFGVVSVNGVCSVEVADFPAGGALEEEVAGGKAQAGAP